jgi:hypothetical protein
MKITLHIIVVFLFASCSQKKENEDKDTFSLKKVDVAMIYEKKTKDIPCLFYNVTDTIKSNPKIGIVFRLEVNYDNPQKGSHCCAFEPGVDGTKEKIKKVKVVFKSNNSTLDVTDKLSNIEEAQMFNSFEKYMQAQLNINDFSCECYEQKSGKLIENLKREHLGGKLIKSDITKNRNHIIKNIDDFINLYNSLAGETYKGTYDNRGLYSGSRISSKNYYFWLPENFNTSLEKFNELEIEIELLNGRKLKHTRVLK